MGAANIAQAYQRWAGKVPPLSMVLLTYMALISVDSDREPWYSQGHRALAELALGRPAPITASDLRAVERAITPLLRAGAIVPNRRASVRRDGHSTVRYLLVINDRTEAHARRFTSGDKSSEPVEPPAEIPPQDSQRPTESDTHARRFPTSRPTESVTTPDGNRRTEEYEEKEELEEEEEIAVRAAVTVPRATEAANKPEISPTEPNTEPPPATGRPHHCEHGLKIARRPDGTSNCALCRRATGPPATAPPTPATRPALRVITGGAA